MKLTRLHGTTLGFALALLVLLASAQSRSVHAEPKPAPQRPWIEADEALARGDVEEARRIAASATTADAKALRAYLASPPKEPAGLRETLRKTLTPEDAPDIRNAFTRIRTALPESPSILRGRILLAIGTHLESIGEHAEAAGSLKECAEAGRDLGWLMVQERALKCRFQLLRGLARYSEMLPTTRWLLEVQRAIGDVAPATLTESDLGALEGTLGDYVPARMHLASAWATLGKLGLTEPALIARSGLGLVALRQGRYAESLEHIEETLQGAEDADCLGVQAYALNLLGLLREHLGDCAAAIRAYEGALALYGDEPSAEKADVLGNLGNARAREGRYEEALAALRQVRDIFKAAELPADVGQVHLAEAEVLLLSGDARGAAKAASRAWKILENHPTERVRVLVALAEIHLAAGEIDRATSRIEMAMKEEDEAAYHITRVELWRVAARVARTRGRTAEALAYACTALDLAEEVLTGQADHHAASGRSTFAATYEVGLGAALTLGKPDAVLEMMERGRAGALREALGGRNALQVVALPRELLEAEGAAEAALTAARYQWEAARATGDFRKIRPAGKILEETRIERRRVTGRLQREAKRVARVTHPQSAPLAELVEARPPGTILVLYAFNEGHVHALVIGSGKPAIRDLGEAAPIRVASERVGFTEEPPDWKARLAHLAGLVVTPLDLPEGAVVLVSPDDCLHSVPWPLLMEGRETSCIPSATVWHHLAREGTRRGGPLLALGDPDYSIEHDGRRLALHHGGSPIGHLESSGPEVRALRRANDTVLTRRDATEAALEEALEKEKHWSAVHFACHGFVDEVTPSLSSLALTPAAPDDGFLTALEVFGMNIPTDLVVLSACETGRGRYVRGEGLVGLARSFMAAGAPRVLASLWQVDDEATRVLMTAFHERWRAGATASLALREAQREVRKRWPHPHDWGAWVIWGLPGLTHDPRGQSKSPRPNSTG